MLHTGLLQELDARYKAEVEARRAARREAEARQLSMSELADEKFAAAQESTKVKLATGTLPGTRSKTKKGGK